MTPSRTPTSTGAPASGPASRPASSPAALAPTNTLVGQPHRPQARLRHRRAEPGAGRPQPARRPPAHPDAAPGGLQPVPRRRDRRRDARRGRVPQRGRGGHPVHAHDADRARPCPFSSSGPSSTGTTSSTSPRTAASSSTPSAEGCRCSSRAGATPGPSTPTGTSTPTRRLSWTPRTPCARSPGATPSARSACARAASCSPRPRPTSRRAGDDRVAHAAFGVSQIDMSVPNVAALALHPALTGATRVATEATGVVDGRAIAAVFSWLRPTELGLEPVGEQLPHGQGRRRSSTSSRGTTTRRACRGPCSATCCGSRWTTSSRRPDGLTLLGTPVDLGELTADTYVVGAETDHLVPWQGAYRSTQLFGGDSTFVLSGGGHIQHLVNPPGNPKAHFRTGPVAGRTRTAGWPARPSSRAAGGRTGRTGPWPGRARSGPPRRRSAAGATARSSRPRGGT